MPLVLHLARRVVLLLPAGTALRDTSVVSTTILLQVVHVLLLPLLDAILLALTVRQPPLALPVLLDTTVVPPLPMEMV